MGKYFGTDGFRGEANVNLTVNHAYKIGRYLGYYYGKLRPARVVIAKDTRLSGYMFEYALVSGLMASGATTCLLHVSPTPSVSYIVRKEHFDCGIMISASHNPFYDNGIKVVDGEGKKISVELENLMEDYFEEAEDTLPFATRDKIGKTVDYQDARSRYIDYLASIPANSFEGMRIGLDAGNGACSALVATLFERLGAEVHIIHNHPNGMNINKNCGSTNMSDLSQLVVDKGLDLGFGYDGDVDRCLAVDEKGNLVHGDHILYMCACYLKSKERLPYNTIVATVTSNMGLKTALTAKGINMVITEVGDRNVAQEMFDNGYNIGGEQSGHIIFGEYGTTGDGMMTSLIIADIVKDTGLKLSELAKDVHILPQKTLNVTVKDKEAAFTCKELNDCAAEIEKEMNGSGRIYLRKSGTEPYLRIMVEATSEELCDEYTKRLAATIIDK